MSYDKPRINNLGMSAMDMILALGGGNPGALRVLTDLFTLAPTVDPDSLLGAFGPLMNLDSMDVYEHRIWDFYKMCGQDYYRMLAVMRSSQLGFIDQAALNKAIDRQGTIDIDALVAQVKERLPKFQTAAPAAEKTEAVQ